MTLVLDSSALVAALIRSRGDGIWAAEVMEGEAFAAPDFLLAETMNTIRRMELAGSLLRAVAQGAFYRALGLRVELHPFFPYAERVWELRFNLTAYDAWYVAIAEALGCPLATLDLRMARAAGTRCEFLLPHPVA